MRNTLHFFKRQEVKKIIDKVLNDSQTILSPISITTSESLNDDFTTTDFSFEQKGSDPKIVSIVDQKGKGFIDGLFTGLYNHYQPIFDSLSEVKLLDLSVNPISSLSKTSIGTDAQASVLFSVYVKNHGAAEFQHQSRSMIYSSFVLALETFEFYINCERAFDKIQTVIDDAKHRNRSDIISKCMYDLSKLTEVNNYEKKERN